MVLLRRAVMTTLVWLSVRSTHWRHYGTVRYVHVVGGEYTYWFVVASGTSEELARRVACTS